MTDPHNTITGGQTKINSDKNIGQDNIKKLLDTGTINDISIEITHPHPDRWDFPGESFKFPEGSVKHATLHVGIDVDDWLMLSYKAHLQNAPELFTYNEFLREAYDETVERVAEDIKNNSTDDIPTPVLEIDPDYTVTYGEGRSRGLGAKKAGLDVIPIWIAARCY